MKLSPRQAECEALRAEGLSLRQIAKRLGVSNATVSQALRGARAKREAETSPGVEAALEATNLDGLEARHGWAKVDGHSVFWKRDLAAEQERDALAEIATAFESLEPAPPIAAPDGRLDFDVLNVIPIPDAHVGMHSWGKETGEDYDLKKACARVTSGVAGLLNSMPAAGTALVLNLGDFNHAESDEARTPASKHALDIDGRHYKTVDASIEILARAIEWAAQTHERVIYRGLTGNHDPYTAMAVTLALKQRYRDTPRVEIMTDPSAHFFFEWGNVLIAAHHGDGVTPERLVLRMADLCPAWRGGSGQFRHLYTGHLHHFKAKDIGGVLWEQLRAVCPKDAYAAKHAYSARSTMVGVSFDKKLGEFSRMSRHF